MPTTDDAQSIIHEVAVAGAKAAPAVSVSAWHYVLNLPVEKWVSIAVLVFTILQVVVLIRDKFVRDRDTKRKQVRK